MFAAERRQAILELVRANGAVRLRDIAAQVGTSEVTVRRDLRLLEEQGLLDRRRGGAAAPGVLSQEPTYVQKSHTALHEKRAIAALAASLVDDGDAVVLGAGTTTEELARRLVGRRDLTVVTNSMLVGTLLAHAPGVEVVMTGGQLRGSTFALVGSAAEQSLEGVRVRTAFLSGNGLTVARGLSTPNMAAASMDRVLVGAAQELVVLADHTKLGVDTMFQTAPPEHITRLVTDDRADPEQLEGLRALGVEVLQARAG
ncbi:DeoR/GlpR family DNA-binding transcription regulator [Cellulomonas massiliensis]|uniref:DeoR/GlpR family DNA-binding transcription regulator n=1 Tax=Cellulomonas massiliensis TaxID=1465811 RepID=UPI00035E6AB4|nr:DeoR/GlpR family DNA-binding transcription regulator [Cellulomonas massiliensis]